MIDSDKTESQRDGCYMEVSKVSQSMQFYTLSCKKVYSGTISIFI